MIFLEGVEEAILIPVCLKEGQANCTLKEMFLDGSFFKKIEFHKCLVFNSEQK